MTDENEIISPVRSWQGHDWSVWWQDHKTKIFVFFSVLVGLGIGIATFFIPSLNLQQSLEAGCVAWFTATGTVFTVCTKLDFYFTEVKR